MDAQDCKTKLQFLPVLLNLSPAVDIRPLATEMIQLIFFFFFNITLGLLCRLRKTHKITVRQRSLMNHKLKNSSITL